MKKFVFSIFVLVFMLASFASSAPCDEAKALFEKGDYLKGINILTKALNDPDPVQRANALQVYAAFYENLVGNTAYAQSLYSDILGTNLPADNQLKISAQKEISRLNSLKSQYSPQDTILKKLQATEIISPLENSRQAQQLISIIKKNPDYYRLSEVYYQLGRSYLSSGNYHQAYLILIKSVEFKPAVNFYLPVNVYKDMAYSKWIRSTINSICGTILGILLILTIIVFYSSRPWQWLKPGHLAVILIIVLLWLVVFSVSYILLASGNKLSDKTIADISATTPYFITSSPGSPNWQVLKNLFIYGIVGLSGLFVFSLAASRLKHRWATILINTVFTLLLFASLMTIFYMQNCDQKSTFYSHTQNEILQYIDGSNYFVSFAMEPYILTNPKAYPDLALTNVVDTYMKEWMLKYCPFSPPANKPAQ
jgi:tetratricopeptide (TPR) repeat protein